MANIVFDSEMHGALTRFENDLNDSTISNINNFKNSITYRIIDLARENTRRYRNYLSSNISDLKIENIMVSYFKELESLEKENIKKAKDSLRQITDSIIRISEKKDIDELESTFVVLTNEMLRKSNFSQYEKINQNYAKQVKSYISSCFLYTPKIDEMMSNIQNETRKLLNNQCQRFIDEYKKDLKSYLARYREHILEYSKEQLKGNVQEGQKSADNHYKQEKNDEQRVQIKNIISPNEMQFIIPTVKKFGLIIEETFDGFTIKTANSNGSMMLHKGDNGHFFTDDHSIEIAEFGSNGTSVTIGDKTIIETTDTYYLGTRNNPRKIELKMDFLEYNVTYAGVKQTDVLKKGIVIDEIAKNYPDFYNYISNESIFVSMKQEIEEARNASEELQKDDYGKIYINPNTRESFVDKVSALGFALEEREDGVYAIDRNGDTHKLQYNSGYAYFEDNPHIGFNTSTYFVTENEIRGPQINYHINNDVISCSSDYLFLTISGAGKVCRIGFDSNNEFVCEIDLGDKIIRNRDTVKKIVQKACPEMYKKLAYACLEHEKNMQNSAEKREDNYQQPSTKNEIPQENNQGKMGDESIDANTSELLNELDSGDITEKVNIASAAQDIKEDINIVEQELEGKMSLEEEIFLLEQDPNVQRYIELMKIKEEQNAINQASTVHM